VAASGNAKLAANSTRRIATKKIDYYIAKLDELVKMFGGLSVPTATQEMLAL
jgi:hypothetical protein